MSAQKPSDSPASKTKKFGKGEREVPHHTQKAKKFYPAEDESKPRKVRLIHLETELLFTNKNLCGEAVMPCYAHAGSHIFLSITCGIDIFGSATNSHANIHLSLGPQIRQTRTSTFVPCSRLRPYPPRWSFPRQARHPPQASPPRCSPRHGPL